MRVLVVIPVFNNAQTVGGVASKALSKGFEVLAINDGSTDETENVLKQIKNINLISLPLNCGKGNALRHAFLWAEKQGYTHIITIDADGQHNPDEIEKFAEEIKHSPDSIIIGCRDFSSNEIPLLSRLGRSMSNLAFKIVSGIKLDDTQSGFRAYPIKKISKIHTSSNKFDFEMELLLKVATLGTKIQEIKISVIYNRTTIKGSHFKPLADTFRICSLFFRKFLKIQN